MGFCLTLNNFCYLNSQKNHEHILVKRRIHLLKNKIAIPNTRYADAFLKIKIIYTELLKGLIPHRMHANCLQPSQFIKIIMIIGVCI